MGEVLDAANKHAGTDRTKDEAEEEKGKASSAEERRERIGEKKGKTGWAAPDRQAGCLCFAAGLAGARPAAARLVAGPARA